MADLINAFVGFFVDFFSALTEFLGGNSKLGSFGDVLGDILDMTV